jgi:cytochrome oxidase assembly protein ShyY1
MRMDALKRHTRARREILVVALGVMLAIVVALGLWQAYGVLLHGTAEANVP